MRAAGLVRCVGLSLIVLGLLPAAGHARPPLGLRVLMTTYGSPVFDGQHRLFYQPSADSGRTLDTRTSRSRPLDLHGCQPMSAYHAALLVNCREHSYSDPTPELIGLDDGIVRPLPTANLTQTDTLERLGRYWIYGEYEDVDAFSIRIPIVVNRYTGERIELSHGETYDLDSRDPILDDPRPQRLGRYSVSTTRRYHDPLRLHRAHAPTVTLSPCRYGCTDATLRYHRAMWFEASRATTSPGGNVVHLYALQTGQRTTITIPAGRNTGISAILLPHQILVWTSRFGSYLCTVYVRRLPAIVRP